MAKAVRLNKTIRDDISNSLLSAINKTMYKSVPGKELIAGKIKIEKAIRRLVRSMVTDDEMATLIKFASTSTCRKMLPVINKYTKNIRVAWTLDKDSLVISFDPPLLTPKTQSFSSSCLLQQVEDGKKTKGLVSTVLKFNEYVICEIAATHAAFMEAVKRNTTVKSLIAEIPELVKHIPTNNDTVITTSKESTSIRNNFKL